MLLLFIHEILFSVAVLSDENKRFLYDVGVYESDDDESVSPDPLQPLFSVLPCAANRFLDLIGPRESTSSSVWLSADREPVTFRQLSGASPSVLDFLVHFII